MAQLIDCSPITHEFNLQHYINQSVLTHNYNPSTEEVGAGR